MIKHRDIELWEPFDSLMPFLSGSTFSESRKKKINDSLVADIFGEERIDPPQAGYPIQVGGLLYAILEVYGSMARFDTYASMFSIYPWKKTITRGNHFESVYYLFVHECYVFEERLKKFFNAAEKYAKLRKINLDIAPIRRRILRIFHQTFRDVLRMRGQHVHEDDYVPRDIKRIGLLELLSSGVGERQTKPQKLYAPLIGGAVRDARRTWVKNCTSAKKAIEDIAKISFRDTKSIWSHLKREIEVPDQQD